MSPRGKARVLGAGSAAAEWGTKSFCLEAPGELRGSVGRVCHPLQHNVPPGSAPRCRRIHSRGTWQLSHLPCKCKKPCRAGLLWRRPRGRRKLVNLVTSVLVQVEAKACNILFRRGCAVVKLPVKEVMGRREKILSSEGPVS